MMSGSSQAAQPATIREGGRDVGQRRPRGSPSHALSTIVGAARELQPARLRLEGHGRSAQRAAHAHVTDDRGAGRARGVSRVRRRAIRTWCVHQRPRARGNMLTIRELSKTYANGVRALDRVTLEVPKGMFGLL